MKQLFYLLFIVVFLGLPIELSAADKTSYYALDKEGEAHKVSPD